MRNILALLTVCFSILSASSGWAHEGIHVMGTVTAIDATHLDVKTPQGGSVSVTLTDKTAFASKNTPSTPRPKVGDRVVIDVVKDGNGLKALEMEFSTPGDKAKSSK
jgi:hypothetical protein